MNFHFKIVIPWSHHHLNTFSVKLIFFWLKIIYSVSSEIFNRPLKFYQFCEQPINLELKSLKYEGSCESELNFIPSSFTIFSTVHQCEKYVKIANCYKWFWLFFSLRMKCCLPPLIRISDPTSKTTKTIIVTRNTYIKISNYNKHYFSNENTQ